MWGKFSALGIVDRPVPMGGPRSTILPLCCRETLNIYCALAK